MYPHGQPSFARTVSQENLKACQRSFSIVSHADRHQQHPPTLFFRVFSGVAFTMGIMLGIWIIGVSMMVSVIGVSMMVSVIGVSMMVSVTSPPPIPPATATVSVTGKVNTVGAA